jgi:hypothetical protein
MMAAAGREVEVEHGAGRPGELRCTRRWTSPSCGPPAGRPATSLRDGLKKTLDHIERETKAR